MQRPGTPLYNIKAYLGVKIFWVFRHFEGCNIHQDRLSHNACSTTGT
ncbi:hypothetical protein NC651_006662 [Populus alba x Populus x berolinensis]|nr:hypothetical protein NC651_006662 [Populus alba x Populus x berolinensis]